LGIPASRIHRVHGEEPAEIAAANAEVELRQMAARGPSAEPVVDLIFLGLGEEGHVASLFPGESEALMASAAVYRPVVVSKPPPRRITLGYSAIEAARQVWVLASGPGKASALSASLKSEGQTPLARVIRSRPHTRIFTDSPVKG
jgi:6-phosphogluconolactonase